jgi:hypothetical protein
MQVYKKKQFRLYFLFFAVAAGLYVTSYYLNGVHQTWVANIGSAFLGAGLMHLLIKMNG